MNAARSIAFRLLPPLAQILPLNGLIRVTGKRIIFPFYHLVSDEEVPHIKHLYPVRRTKEFRKDLDLFLKHYQPVGIQDLLDSVKNDKPIPGNSFLLSFDDGLREFHDVAAPVLREKGIPAICFLNSGFIGNKDLFYRYKASLLIERLCNGKASAETQKDIAAWFTINHLPLTDDYKGLLSVSFANRHLLDQLALKLDQRFDEFLLKERPYLDSTQVHSLLRQGFSFGAHSINHPEYRFLDEEEQIRQTVESIHAVTGEFGITEKLFSFPFTDYGVKRSYFDSVFNPSQPLADLTFGGAGLKNDSVPKNIQRIPFEGTSLNAKEILSTEYLYFIIKSIFGKNIIRR
ncbi:MAG: polysaccharide deacetylase family protein [Bacteroidetes bacterium]|nr:polysaccharide deacetylase family protein [Bacteroidota bacterium]